MPPPVLWMPLDDPDGIHRAAGQLRAVQQKVDEYLTTLERKVQAGYLAAWESTAGRAAMMVVYDHLRNPLFEVQADLKIADELDRYADSVAGFQAAVGRLQERSDAIAAALRRERAVPNGAMRMEAIAAADAAWRQIGWEHETVMAGWDTPVRSLASALQALPGSPYRDGSPYRPPATAPVLDTAPTLRVAPHRLDEIAAVIDPLISGSAAQAGQLRSAQSLLLGAIREPQLTPLVEPALKPIGDYLAGVSSTSRDLAGTTRAAARYYREHEEQISASVPDKD